MADLSKYPSLQRLIELLSMTVFPASRQDDEIVHPEYGEKVIGELTAGESHLYLAMEEAEEATEAVKAELEEGGKVTPEVIEKVFNAHFLHTNFWKLIHERCAGEFETDPPSALDIRRGFQIVHCFEDCGCGKGLRCAVVMAGLIDPKTGEEKVPENAEAAAEAFTLIQTEGDEECVEWADRTLVALGRELGLLEPDEADLMDETDTDPPSRSN